MVGSSSLENLTTDPESEFEDGVLEVDPMAFPVASTIPATFNNMEDGEVTDKIDDCFVKYVHVLSNLLLRQIMDIIIKN